MQEQIRIRWARLIVNMIYTTACIAICILTLKEASFVIIIVVLVASILCDILINNWYITSLQQLIRDKRMWEQELKQLKQLDKII